MTEPHEERRQSPRHRVLKGGKIVFNDGRAVVDCQVRNLAEAGARLKQIGIAEAQVPPLRPGQTFSGGVSLLHGDAGPAETTCRFIEDQ